MSSIVARCNGTLVVQDGERVGVVEQGGGWIPVAIFVTALLALILLVNGIVMLFVAGVVGAALAAGGVVAGVTALGGSVADRPLRRHLRRRRRARRHVHPRRCHRGRRR
jgi:hypothetical protein